MIIVTAWDNQPDDGDDSYDCYDCYNTCGECGRLTAGDSCDQCGVPLCPMCSETGAGFCKLHPDVNFRAYDAEGDVALITAAPDLLAACEAAVDNFDAPLEGCDCGECEAGRQLRAAIAKAKKDLDL